MTKCGIQSKATRKVKATTNSKHDFPVAPNLLARAFSPPSENRVWVADITYVSTSEGWLYLAGIIDLYSRKVVGWAMGDRMTRELTLRALRMAVDGGKPPRGLMDHPDRGSQYASTEYQRFFASHGTVCSMSRESNSWDNAPMESIFHTLKT